MKIEILRTHGYQSLKSVALPITVSAQKAYDGCYEVYAEEFRPYGADEWKPEANDGKGLSFSFYSEGSFRVINQRGSK